MSLILTFVGLEVNTDQAMFLWTTMFLWNTFGA